MRFAFFLAISALTLPVLFLSALFLMLFSFRFFLAAARRQRKARTYNFYIVPHGTILFFSMECLNMITGVFGLPRSGKSTFLAKIAKKSIKKGIKVYSNYYIKGCYKLNFFDLGVHDYSDCLILIDEISLVADSRDWKNFNSNLVYFFTNHGHYNVDIIYCSQDYKDCDIKIRNLTQDLYYIRSLPLGFSYIRNISRTISIDTDIATVYQLSGFPRFVFRPFYYKLFDSFVRRPLPPNKCKPW